MPANLENSAVATGLEKVSFHSNPKKRNAKECSNYCTIALISHASKEMFKILQAWLQQNMNHELSDVQAGFRIDRVTRDQIVNTCWIIKKAKEFHTKSTSALLTMPKPLTVWITTNCGKFLKRWPVFWEICMQVRKQQWELDMEEQTRSKSGKEYVKAVCCHPAYSIYMQTTSWEMLDWMKHKLESRLPGEISIISYMWRLSNNHPHGRKQRRTKEPLDESERGEWKSWLKAQHSENEDHGIWSHHFMVNRWGNSENSDKLYFSGLQNHCRRWLQPWN